MYLMFEDLFFLLLYLRNFFFPEEILEVALLFIRLHIMFEFKKSFNMLFTYYVTPGCVRKECGFLKTSNEVSRDWVIANT